MTVYFPDISSYQAGISLQNALAVICKATEGTGYVNPDYAPAKARAAGSGTFFNSYHFLLEGNGAAQAAHAFGVVGRSVPLMVDFEPEPPIGSHPTMADAETFIDAYRRAGGVTHLLYLPKWYWEDLGRPSLTPFLSRGMALVSSNYTTYTDANSGPGWQPYGGMTPAVWQYTSSLQFNGKSVDFNAFRGSYPGREDPASVAACLAEFRQLVTTGRYSATPPEPAGITWAMWPPNVTLREGSTGNAVKVLQTACRNSGIRGVRGITVDGIFGEQTLTAVRNFQLVKFGEAGVDGIAGPKTRAALAALDDL